MDDFVASTSEEFHSIFLVKSVYGDPLKS